MKMRWLMLVSMLLLLAACGDEKPKSSKDDECAGSESSKSGGSSKQADEKPADEGEEPEKLPDLPGEEVRTNQIYQRGETLKMSVFGVSFKLPENTACGIQQDAAAMELAAIGKQCMGFIYLKRDVKEDEIVAQLKQAQPIDETVVLQPQGEPVRKGDAWFFRHADSTYEGHTALIIGPQGNGVLFFLGGYKSDSDLFKGIVESLAASAKVGTPLESQSIAQWKQLLSGYMLTYMKSYSSTDGVGGGVYSSTKKEIRLYPDGTYSYDGSDSYSINTGGGGSAGDGGRDTETGTWKVEQVGAAHTLILESEGGTREYSIAYSEEKTYLDGTRWFRTVIE